MWQKCQKSSIICHGDQYIIVFMNNRNVLTIVYDIKTDLILKWQLLLKEYSPDFLHMEGIHNDVADLISCFDGIFLEVIRQIHMILIYNVVTYAKFMYLTEIISIHIPWSTKVLILCIYLLMPSYTINSVTNNCLDCWRKIQHIESCSPLLLSILQLHQWMMLKYSWNVRS